MKLKKIASLALAGLMAVSMLAGCSDKGTGNTEAGEVVAGTSSIAKVFNDNQSAANDAKITFTADASLNSALSKAAKMIGGDAAMNDAELLNALVRVTGMNTGDDVAVTAGDFYGANGQKNGVDVKDGAKLTYMYVNVLDTAQGVWSEDAAAQMTADYINDVVSQLAATTYEKGVTTEDYFDYTYTGTVSIVSVKGLDGNTNYFVAYTVTQTAAKETIKEQ